MTNNSDNVATFEQFLAALANALETPNAVKAKVSEVPKERTLSTAIEGDIFSTNLDYNTPAFIAVHHNRLYLFENSDKARLFVSSIKAGFLSEAFIHEEGNFLSAPQPKTLAEESEAFQFTYA